MAEDLKTLPWMSDATKVGGAQEAGRDHRQDRLPDHWKDYSSIVVKRDDLLGNVERADFERKRNLDKFGKPVDPTEWGMTPPTVNAYYNPPQNNINFPAGILQPPFYDNSMDPAVNFGGIGVVIGHEMTHGFDDQGSKYDLHGNVKVWWTPRTWRSSRSAPSARPRSTTALRRSGAEPERASDAGREHGRQRRLRIAYQALMARWPRKGGAEPGYVDGKRDGYTPAQRFFIRFGQVWCQNQTEQSARVLGEDRSAQLRASGGPTGRCRTSTSSARRLAARWASR
jgi:putative endopeptidase